jgi:carboxyl-terminal processing protease
MKRQFAVLFLWLTPLFALGQERFDAVLDLVQKKYLHRVERPELEARALRSFLERLDPYSNYLDAQEWALYESRFTGSFGGIGVAMAIDAEARLPKVDYLLIGSSAAEAGVRRGDHFAAIDGKSLEGLTMEDVVPLLRGTPGSTVELTVRRAGETIPLTLQRRAVMMPSVRGVHRDANGEAGYLLEGGIGYVRILQFGDDTVDLAERAFASLKNAKGIVLDLRDCNGGKMSAAVKIADLLLDKGRIVSVVERDATEHFDATPGVATTVPVVMLINDQTASSAEILAGALADNGRVTVIGQRTFGKGRVQEKIALADGMGGIVLSTGTFQRPSGKTIDKHDAKTETEAGIAPEIEVPLEKAELEAWRKEMNRLDGPFILTAEEQKPAAPDRVLRRALEVLQK